MAHGRNILILSIVFLVGSFATNLIGPIWPIYITSSLHASMTELGFVFSASNAVAAITQILSGFLSDKYGRKRLHALGTLLAAFPPLMYALANNWLNLVPWAMLSGLAIGLYLPMRWAIVADASSTETMASAYSWMNISWLLGSTVAPFVGGVIADYFNIRSPFFVCSTMILCAFPLTLFMQETKRKQTKADADKNEKSSTPSTWLFAVVVFSLINIVQGIGIGVTAPVISVFLVSHFPVDYTFVGIWYAITFGLASIAVQIPAGKCSDRFDRRWVMFVTFLTSSPFFVLFAYSQNVLELIVFMFVANATLSASWPAFQTLMMEATPSAKWGFVNGLSATTFWVGQMMGNALSGVLWDGVGWWAPFYASGFAIGLSTVLPLLLKETRPEAKNL